MTSSCLLGFYENDVCGMGAVDIVLGFNLHHVAVFKVVPTLDLDGRAVAVRTLDDCRVKGPVPVYEVHIAASVDAENRN